MSQRALWDVEDVAEMPKVRDMHVGPVSTSDVDEFCQRYHYTGTGGSQLVRWGLWSDVTLYGIVTYNPPAPNVGVSAFGRANLHRLWHMGRLACSDDAPRNSESRLISGSLRNHSRVYPDAWGVVTYAATGSGHLGYVYQATNALYCGTGGHGLRLVDGSGRQRSARQGKSTISAAEAARRGWEIHVDPIKHRYLYLLGSRTQRRHVRSLLRWPVLPYPKAERCDQCAGTGEQFPTTPCETCGGTGTTSRPDAVGAGESPAVPGSQTGERDE